MDWLEFTYSVIGSMSWPLAILGIIFLLLNEIKAALAKMEHARAGPEGFEVTFNNALLQDTKQGLEELGSSAGDASVPPRPGPRPGDLPGEPAGAPYSPVEPEDELEGDEGDDQGVLGGSAPREETSREEHRLRADEQLRWKRKEEFYAMAREAPRAAIIETWLLVELEVRAAALRSGHDLSDNPPPELIVKRLEAWNLLLPSRVNTYVENLHVLRNQAVHLPEPPTEANAIDYIDTAMLLIHYLRQAI
jgi:hypothetical protein